MAEKYGIVDWYVKSKGMDFDDWVRRKNRDKVFEDSSKGFFTKIMDFAKNKAVSSKMARIMQSLKSDTRFKNKSLEQIKGGNLFISGADEFFDKNLKIIVDRTKLPKEKKELLINEIPNYDEERDFENLVNEEIKIWKSEIKTSEKLKRITELKREAEREFNRGDLDSLISIRNQARKYKRDYPDEFSEIDSWVRGLRLQLRQEQRERTIRQQREARERKLKLEEEGFTEEF